MAKRAFYLYAVFEGPNAPTAEQLESILEYSTAREALAEASDCDVRLAVESEDDEVSMSECNKCGSLWKPEELAEVRDFGERVPPGDTMPSGECPECGALCYPAE